MTFSKKSAFLHPSFKSDLEWIQAGQNHLNKKQAAEIQQPGEVDHR
jgi:hypothetical protein